MDSITAPIQGALHPFASPEVIGAGLEGAAEYLQSQVRSNGAIRSPCASRSFESLLVLQVLRKLRLAPNARNRLRAFLVGAVERDPCDPFAPLAQLIAKGSPFDPGIAITGLIDEFEHHTLQRKRLYFDCILSELSEAPRRSINLADFDAGGPHQSWTELILVALKISHAAATDRLEQVPGVQVRMLKSLLTDDGLYEHNVMCGALGLLALLRLDPLDAKRRSLNLLKHQRPDGGFPFFVVHIDIFATSLAGLALHQTLPLLPRQGRASVFSTLRKMATFVASQQADDGGWSYARGIRQTDVDDTSYAAQLLARVDVGRYREHLHAVRRYLLSMQDSDGGWPTYLRGQPVEAAMTAGAIEALATFQGQNNNVLLSITQGVNFLCQIQRDDGTFERSWSRAETNAIFRVLRALESALFVSRGTCYEPQIRVDQERIRRRAMGYLNSARTSSGGWGQRIGDPADAVSTAYGLLGLGLSEAAWLPKGLAVILRHQLSSGEIVAPSDQFGPRPLVWTTPQVGSAVATFGLAYGLALLGAQKVGDPYDSEKTNVV